MKDVHLISCTFSEIIYKIKSIKTLHFTGFCEKAHVFCIFVIRGEGHKLESFWGYSRVVNTARGTVLDKFRGYELVFTAGKNAAITRRFDLLFYSTQLYINTCICL